MAAPTTKIAPVLVAGAVAALLLAGGGMGYAKKRSIASLVAGGLFSLGFAYAASELSAPESVANGRRDAALLSVLLFVMMGSRALRTGAPVPKGLAVVGGLASAYFGLLVLEYRS